MWKSYTYYSNTLSLLLLRQRSNGCPPRWSLGRPSAGRLRPGCENPPDRRAPNP